MRQIVLLMALVVTGAQAQDFPSKPVRIVVGEALGLNAVRERYQAMGVEVMDMAQPQFDAYVRTDYQKWQKVARDGNISVE